jgi:hypothetical protein
MSLFGENSPKFIVGSTTINLLHSKIIDMQLAEPDIIEQRSIITGSKYFAKRVDADTCNYSSFSIVVYLNKYANPNTKLTEIKAYINTEIDQFFMHSDGTAIKDKDGNTVKFFMTMGGFTYQDGINKLPALTLNFTSLKYTDFSKSIL